MNILITGGTGLIGLAFIKQFKDDQFTLLSRDSSKARSILPSQVKVINSLASLDNLNDFDAVINLAGEPIIDKRWDKLQKSIICQSRWQITQKLVDLFSVSEQPPQVFISGSAIGIYGNRDTKKLTESSSLIDNDFPSKVCLEWENIAQKATPYTRVVLIRTGIVLSTKGGALTKMLLPFKLGLGGKVSSGEHYMSWIHIQDHINAIQHVISQPALTGAVNLVAPEPEQNNEFTRQLAKALKRIAIMPAPKWLLTIILGESSCLLTDSQRVLPDKLTASGFEFKYPNLKSAFSQLLVK